jgi:hypothetical protein
MNWSRTSGALLVLALLLGASGCKNGKKKTPNLPTQAQAPTITNTQPMTTQPGPPPPITMEPARPLPTPSEVAANIPPEPPPPKPRQRAPRKSAPPKKTVTVVENTPPPPPQQPPAQTQQGSLTASVGHKDALQQKVDTQQQLDATENNLRSVTRNLSDDEQLMVTHIRSYIQQSKNATTDGDLERAYNLALKARLLSDELVKK